VGSDAELQGADGERGIRRAEAEGLGLEGEDPSRARRMTLLDSRDDARREGEREPSGRPLLCREDVHLVLEVVVELEREPVGAHALGPCVEAQLGQKHVAGRRDDRAPADAARPRRRDEDDLHDRDRPGRCADAQRHEETGDRAHRARGTAPVKAPDRTLPPQHPETSASGASGADQ